MIDQNDQKKMRGLTNQEAIKRLNKYGPNFVEEKKTNQIFLLTATILELGTFVVAYFLILDSLKVRIFSHFKTH